MNEDLGVWTHEDCALVLIDWALLARGRCSDTG
jgi:hypothetical protein